MYALTVIHLFLHSYTEQAKPLSCPRACFTLARRAEQQNFKHAAAVYTLMLHVAPDETITSLETLTLRYEHFLCNSSGKAQHG